MKTDGALLCVTGNAERKDIIAALVGNIWKSYSKSASVSMGAEDLQTLILDCEVSCFLSIHSFMRSFCVASAFHISSFFPGLGWEACGRKSGQLFVVYERAIQECEFGPFEAKGDLFSLSFHDLCLCWIHLYAFFCSLLSCSLACICLDRSIPSSKNYSPSSKCSHDSEFYSRGKNVLSSFHNHDFMISTP